MSMDMEAVGIKDCWWSHLKIISAQGGPVLHFLKRGELFRELFPKGIGEIYFSEIVPGAIKAWKLHTRQNSLFAVPHGLIRLVLYDGREDSFTRGALSVQYLGRPDYYRMLRIAAHVWYGFQCLGNSPALICNCVDIEHDPGEGMRLPFDDPSIPYHWPESLHKYEG